MQVSPLPVTPLQRVEVSDLTAAGVALWLKRDDLLAPVPIGSKLRKLLPFVDEMRRGSYAGMRTFGGPFSNHLHAVAALGHKMGFATRGIVRGAHLADTPTLAACRAWGMELTAVSKAGFDAYVRGEQVSELKTARLSDSAGRWLEVAPGAAHPASVEACARLGDELATQLTELQLAHQQVIVVVPAGYGTTAAGVISGLARSASAARVWVVPAMAGPGEVTAATIANALLAPVSPDSFELRPSRYQRFAPPAPELVAFANQFHNAHGIQLDPIYTVKALDVIFTAAAGEVPPGTNFVALHTGGLQGWR